jgi:hypothetical protein
MEERKRHAANNLAAVVAGIVQALMAAGLILLIHRCMYG